MKRNIILIYKNCHTDNKNEIQYFENFKDAEKEAERMISQFKYWGGGSVPVLIEEATWAKTKGYMTGERTEYKADLYIRFARENGTAYGYYRDMCKSYKIT